MTDPKTLYRRRDPDTSREAAESLNATQLERMVHGGVMTFGLAGCISDDLRRMFPEPPYAYSSITARYKALKDKGLIVYGPDSRKGYNSNRRQGVMRDAEIVKGTVFDPEFQKLI